MPYRADDIEHRRLLRFVTCGGVGDGKSTLIARLLQEANLLHEDQALELVADAPAHEPYMRNMATAASNAHVAVVLIDATKGLQRQAKRHSRIVSLLGIGHVVLAVNKMDLVDWSEARFREIESDFSKLASELHFAQIQAIPLSALHGDNVVARSAKSAWYDGPPLLETLERIDVPDAASAPSRIADSIENADQFQARLIWMSDKALVPGRRYDAKIHSRYVGLTVTAIRHVIDTESGAHLASRSLRLNDIAVVNVSVDQLAPFEPYAKDRSLGSFTVIDRQTKETVGAGMIDFALRRSANIQWQALTVDRAARAAIKDQRAGCFWFTGLPASGKSTIANLLEKRLHAEGHHTFLLDGDNLRHGLNRDLGFTEADRVENIRRVAEVARLMADAGLIVIVALISPFRAERAFARSLFQSGEFVEVYVDTPPEICEQRDPKGLYAKARQGTLKNFTGFDSAYEAPEEPDVWIRTAECTAEAAAEKLSKLLTREPEAR